MFLNKLITYGKLTENQIDQLTPVIINFAAKSRISLAESASQIIKALEGDSRALKEFGISTRDAKTDSERFGVVMEDLGKKVEGAADAFGEIIAGKIEETQQAIRNLKEEVGTNLLPLLRSTLQAISGIIDGVKSVLRSSDDAIQNIFDRVNRDIAKKTSGVISLQTSKSIEEQERLVEGYRATLQATIDVGYKLKANASKKELETQFLRYTQDLDIVQKGEAALANAKAEAAKRSAGDDEENEKKRLALLKKAQEEMQRLLRDWEALSSKIFGSTTDPVLQQIRSINNEAANETKKLIEVRKNGIIDQQKFSEASLRIEQNRIAALHELFSKLKTDITTIGDGLGKFNTALPTINSTSAIPGSDGKLDKEGAAAAAKKFRDLLAKEELTDITTHGQAKLRAELNILDIQKAQELSNVNLIQSERELIEEKYRQRKAAAEEKSFEDQKEHALALAAFIIASAQEVSDIVNLFSDQANARDDEKLQKKSIPV